MAPPEYHFVTRWNVLGTAREVSDVLGDARELPRWWPAVYLAVDELEPGGERGIGRRVRLHTMGFLPYTLGWELRLIESRYPYGFTSEARGDLSGRGVWTFEESGARTLVTFDWRVRAEKPVLRFLSPLFRPLLSANHRWAMARGEESLELELARRRAPTSAEKGRFPAPPPPVGLAPALVLGAGAALGIAAYGLVRRLRRPRPRRFEWRRFR
ncbi:MAG TPA: SRPBCC family protein [Thermoanaerobaculia bacterium]